MCGRMTLTRSAEEIARFFEIASEASFSRPQGAQPEGAGPAGGGLRPRFNIAPSQAVLTVVASPRGGRQLSWKSWGLVPAWAKDPAIAARLFNARGETVDVKPSFRSAFKRRRCLVAADGFYEWTARNRGHRAHWLHPRSGDLLAFAGLYEQWGGPGTAIIQSCTVITTEANADLAEIHARMPVLLERDAWSAWLDPESNPQALKSLLAPAPDGTLAARPVSSHVNDPRHDDPDCLEAQPVLELPLS